MNVFGHEAAGGVRCADSLTGAERAHGTALGREDEGGGGRSSSVTLLLLACRVNAQMSLLLH